jgi:hypothetical protein
LPLACCRRCSRPLSARFLCWHCDDRQHTTPAKGLLRPRQRTTPSQSYPGIGRPEHCARRLAYTNHPSPRQLLYCCARAADPPHYHHEQPYPCVPWVLLRSFLRDRLLVLAPSPGSRPPCGLPIQVLVLYCSSTVLRVLGNTTAKVLFSGVARGRKGISPAATPDPVRLSDCTRLRSRLRFLPHRFTACCTLSAQT